MSLSFSRFTKRVLENKRGRPSITFDLCSERTKRLKSKELCGSTSASLLSYATCMSLKAEGQVQVSKVLKDITTLCPAQANKYREAYKKSLNSQIQPLSESVIEDLKSEERDQLTLFSKWGFDGSSGHSSYKQAFYDLEASDSAVFITYLVPLRLTSGKAIIWENPRPGSTRFCRPIKIEFIKESTNVSIADKNRFEADIKNLRIIKWQARGHADKLIVAQNKARIQKEYKDRCGLIVNKPKPGFGNTNDGNTARRFFQNAELSAAITGIDLDVIKKLHIIMVVVASGFDIDVEKYRQYAHETARYFVSKYRWYNIFNLFLISSDPAITSKQKKRQEKYESCQEKQ
ncbi:hypothetical protein RN001_012468 [Aquatica leii]|uniref:Uncharacterized protein n=1 Tax=Aquatica leii TaxID=1421715 RepID=A0AAN7S7S7_9COLE|nr:hypothetical protein RN001_012468 [Aquatica leii]